MNEAKQALLAHALGNKAFDASDSTAYGTPNEDSRVIQDNQGPFDKADHSKPEEEATFLGVRG